MSWNTNYTSALTLSLHFTRVERAEREVEELWQASPTLRWAQEPRCSEQSQPAHGIHHVTRYRYAIIYVPLSMLDFLLSLPKFGSLVFVGPIHTVDLKILRLRCNGTDIWQPISPSSVDLKLHTQGWVVAICFNMRHREWRVCSSLNFRPITAFSSPPACAPLTPGWIRVWLCEWRTESLKNDRQFNCGNKWSHESVVASKLLLRCSSQINLLFSYWKSLRVALPQSQFSLTRLSVPLCTHVPPNCSAPALLHALPFCLYIATVTLNTIGIDCFASSSLPHSESSAQAGGNIDFGEISAMSPGTGRNQTDL